MILESFIHQKLGNKSKFFFYLTKIQYGHISALYRFEDVHNGLVPCDATRGLHITDANRENRRVQMTAIWFDTAMNCGALVRCSLERIHESMLFSVKSRSVVDRMHRAGTRDGKIHVQADRNIP